MRIISCIIIFIILALLFFGLYHSVILNENVESNYLLTVLATTGALGGIAFAIYGWYTTHEIPKIVAREVKVHIDDLNKKLDEEMYKQQEAIQKMNVVYTIEDSDQKIELLHQVIQLYPKTYNAYVTLGYEYWYSKQDIDTAEEYFLTELDHHPNNYQAMCDLVALYAHIKEYRSALKWMKKTIKTNQDTWKYFERDERLNDLINNNIEEFEEIIKKAKATG